MLGVVSQQRCVRLDGGLKASYVRTVQDSFCASLSNSDPPPPLPVRGGVCTQATFVPARKPHCMIGLLFYKRGGRFELDREYREQNHAASGLGGK